MRNFQAAEKNVTTHFMGVPAPGAPPAYATEIKKGKGNWFFPWL